MLPKIPHYSYCIVIPWWVSGFGEGEPIIPWWVSSFGKGNQSSFGDPLGLVGGFSRESDRQLNCIIITYNIIFFCVLRSQTDVKYIKLEIYFHSTVDESFIDHGNNIASKMRIEN